MPTQTIEETICPASKPVCPACGDPAAAGDTLCWDCRLQDRLFVLEQRLERMAAILKAAGLDLNADGLDF